MANDLKVPALGESVSQATVARWLKKEGASLERDEPLVELETDKVTLEVNAPCSGILNKIFTLEGATVNVGQVLGSIEESGLEIPLTSLNQTPDVKQGQSSLKSNVPNFEKDFEKDQTSRTMTENIPETPYIFSDSFLSPAAQKLAQENAVDLGSISGSGPKGRITKGDVLNALSPSPSDPIKNSVNPSFVKSFEEQGDERVRMTRLRQKIAERLKEAQNTAAMLTTFNEIDMSQLMALREEYRDKFEKRYSTKLGFMSFFIKAAIGALKEIPSVNAEIEGDEIIYKKHYNIGVAVSAPQGLIVPVVRQADQLNFAEIEIMIGKMAERARQNKLTLEDLTGGTFTITNGGVFGSLMSTPILNPPQSGILGMHKIQKRPVVVEDKIEIRPMMYVALTYDHRLIDGREAVTFLIKIKENIEDPRRLLLGI